MSNEEAHFEAKAPMRRWSDELLRFALEAADHGAWEYDVRANVGFWDDKCLDLLGLEGDGVLSKEAFLERVHPSDRAVLMGACEAALGPDADGRIAIKYRLLRPNGAVVSAEVRAQVLFEQAAGQRAASRVVGIMREATSAAEARQALIESEARLRTVFSSIDEGYCLAEMIVDETGASIDYRFLEVNPLFEEMTGLVNAQGRTALELVPNLERYWIEKYGEIAFGGRSERFENGSEPMGRWFDVFAVPVQPRGRFALVFKDVIGRKRAEEAIRSSEARFRHLADHAPAVLWLTDPQGQCTFLSAGWRERTGQEPSEGLGLGWLEMVHAEDRPHSATTFAEANERQEGFSIDYRLRTADGHFRWAVDEARPRFDENGAFLGFIGTVVDIDERKRAEQHRVLLVDELNHRVKNTLAVVQSLASQTFRNSGASPEARAAFDGRLGALAAAHNLLTQVSWERTSLTDIAEAALEVTGPARSRVHVTGPSVPLGAKQAVTFAMALHELCTNAMKYGALSVDRGQVDISWDLSGPELTFAWRETGGPAVHGPPARRGFGLIMIERALAQDLRGSVRLDFHPEGVVCSIRAKLD